MESDIKVTFPGGKRVDAEYKNFLIKTDQPVDVGGEGSAPSPFDLFLASLATCVGYYALSFCQSRDIPTEKASVVIRTEKNSGTKMIEKVNIELRLPPEFPDKYQQAVIKSVNQCAVKEHIFKPPAFETKTEIMK
tara:strand:+ start:283 stop:687 length:405 start_codon:yes stop_codon:yes gene_type:complete